jgi:hypothetical protein
VSEPSVPTDVNDEETTLDARVVPVRVPAGAVPVIFPVKLPVPLVKKRLVVEAVVEKKLVEVELVVVELVPVKSWRVEEPVTRRLERVVWPEVTPRVPGKT